MTKKPLIKINSSQKNSFGISSDKISKKIRVEVKVYNEKGESVDSAAELWRKPHDNKVDIILIFDVENVEEEIGDESIAWYDFIDYSSKDVYLTNKKDALIKYFFNDVIAETDEYYEVDEKKITNASGLTCKIEKNPMVDSNSVEIIKPHFFKKENETTNFIINEKNITMFAYFNLPRRIENDELMTFPSPSKPKEPFWTPTKIFVAIFAVGLIVALLYFYRKKIWSWIKREDKSKKKEQVEIF
jgi:hypothetical protein